MKFPKKCSELSSLRVEGVFNLPFPLQFCLSRVMNQKKTQFKDRHGLVCALHTIQDYWPALEVAAALQKDENSLIQP